MKWIRLSKKKPPSPGIYAVIIYRKEGYSQPYDEFKSGNRRLITHQLPSNTQVVWAIWKYIEVFEEVTEDKVIYNKQHTFVDSKGDPVLGCVYWSALPKIPNDLILSNDADNIDA